MRNHFIEETALLAEQFRRKRQHVPRLPTHRATMPARSRRHVQAAVLAPRQLTIGQLAVGGDWACADGDIGTLGTLARQLAIRVGEPLHCDLMSLADACAADADDAADAWPQLRERLFR